MIRNPRVEIRRDLLLDNARRMIEMAAGYECEIAAVTKGAAAHPAVLSVLSEAGIEIFADSRIKNLARIKKMGYQQQLYLLRLPMLSEVAETVRIADLSFNSQLETISALDREAKGQGKIHRVILMVDVGDLREGVMPERLLPLARSVLRLDNILLEGIGTNVGCYGGVLPSLEQLQLLVGLQEEIAAELGYQLPKISGGNTATTSLLTDGYPSQVNQLRVGEGILIGYDSTGDRPLEGFHHETFTLVAEVIELEVKPSLPSGKIGRDAFGQIPEFEDRGLRKRAILALGRQDIKIEALHPIDTGAEIIGASSDHLLLEVTEMEDQPAVGGEMTFNMSYSGLMRAMTSSYLNVSIRE